MCGIIHVERTGGHARELIIQQYMQQKSRGVDGFGFVGIKDNVVQTIGRHTTEKGIREKLKTLSELPIMLFHHRYPTSTPNIVESTHPIHVSHEELEHDYYVVHNGVVSNDDFLKEEHEKLGYRYETELTNYSTTKDGVKYVRSSEFNDSEAIAIEASRYIDGKSDRIRGTGSIALVILQINKETQEHIATYYGHNGGSPLNLRTKKGKYFMLASEAKGTALPVNILFRRDAKTGKVSTEKVDIGFYNSTYYGGYTGSGYTNSSYNPIHSDDYEDDDIVLTEQELEQLETDIAVLKDEIKATQERIDFATSEGAIDEAEALQEDLEMLEAEMDEYKEQYMRSMDIIYHES